MKTFLPKLFLVNCVLFFTFQSVKAAVAVTLGTATTTGLATSTSLSFDQTGVGIFGFSIRVTGGTSTFSSFQFTATQTIGTYFSNIKLYSNTINNFTGATQVTGITVSSLNSTALTISGLSQAINTTTKYYFIVADYSVASSAAVSFKLSTTGVTGTTSATGTIAGTTYTLSSSTIDWVGGSGGTAATRSNWNLAANWSPARVPSTFDVVQVSFTNSPSFFPTLSTGTANIASLVIGGQYTTSATITVAAGATLNISGDITLPADGFPGTPNIVNLTGGGSIQANNLNISSNYNAGNTNYTQNVYSSITNLGLAGNVVLTSEKFSASTHNSSFFITAGTVAIGGGIQTINDAGSTSTVQINPASATAGATLEFDGATPLSGLSATGTNIIDFNNAGAEVDYAGTGQTVYTSTAARVSGGTGITYYDLTLSGGTITPAAGTITVANDFITTATAANFNTNNTVLAVGDIAYANGGTMNLGSGAFTLGDGLDVYNSAIFNAGSGNITDANFLRVNAGSAVANFSTGTTTIANSMQLLGGTVNCGTGPISVAAAVQIFSGATFRAGPAPSVFTSTGSYQNFSGATFIVGSGSVYFNGSYSNSGTFTAGTGNVYFNFAGAQSLSDASTAGTTFNNVYFQNSGTKTMSGTGGFAVSSSGVLNMAGSATLAAGGVLILRSDASGSATVNTIPSGTSIIGNVKVERYISGGAGYRGYRILSSPVNVGTVGTNKVYSINYIAGSTYVSGTDGTTGGFTAAGNPSFYLYRENLAPQYSTFLNSNNRGVKNISASPSYTIDSDAGNFNIPIGDGVLYFFRGALNTTANPYSSTSIPATATVTATGTLNQGVVQVVNWFTPTINTLSFTNIPVVANSAIRGFNMVGNPYAASIDLSTFSSAPANVNSAGIYGSNLLPTVWELMPGTNTYGTYNLTTGAALNNGSNIIASGQGFFVQATSNTATLKFNENAKVTTQPSGFRYLASTSTVTTAYSQYMVLNIAKDTTSKMEILIGFNDGSGKNYNKQEDDQYFSGQSASQYIWITSADKFNLVSKWMTLPKAAQADTVNINVWAAVSGQYTITRSALKSIPDLYNIWLIDKYKKDSVNLKQTATYAFNIDLNDTASVSAHRFLIVTRQDPSLAVHLLSFTATKATGALISWKTDNEQNNTNFTVERSTDNGLNFDALGGFLSNGSGAYDFTDKNPLVGVNQYRLKIVDLNGGITYSKVVPLTYSDLGNNKPPVNTISIYPNPARSSIKVSITESALAHPDNISVSIIITGSNGVIVRKAISSQTEWEANVSSLLPGSYVVQVVNNKDKSLLGKTKFVKL